MSSGYTTFNINDVVFVENIGYGVLVDCGHLKTIATKQELPIIGQKKLSIYFDPDMFNSQSDSFYRKKSQCATIVPDPKLAVPVVTPAIQPGQEIVKNNSKTQKNINLVKVKLDGCGFIVTTPDQNIRKYVIVPVRPMFLPLAGCINIKIEIGKTIQSFKRQIFTLLGLQHSHYYNVKFFTTTPCLTQLNSPGKTIWQCSIKQSSILVMTAQHGFCFENIPVSFTKYFATTNNNLTFTHLPKKDIALPPIPKVEVQSTILQQNQSEDAIPKVPSVPIDPSFQSPVRLQNKDQDNKGDDLIVQKPNQEVVPIPIPEQALLIEKAQDCQDQICAKQQQNMSQKVLKQNSIQKTGSEMQEKSIPQFLQLKGTYFKIIGDKYIKSGKHYFEVKLDKLPTNPQHLQISISSQKGQKKWTYFPITKQKVYLETEQVKQKKDYGVCVKQGDSIGVLVKIERNKCMKISFYKNSVGLGVCWEAQITEIHFTFGLGSEGQISLDTRIQQPLDCYRF